MEIIRAYGWQDIPNGYTGIAYWVRYKAYDFFLDRRRHREDGPACVEKDTGPARQPHPTGAYLHPLPVYYLYGKSMDLPTFELHYMLNHMRPYVYDMVKDFKKLEQKRRLVSQRT